MAGFFDHLLAEIQALERSLEHDPRFIKLRELQRVRALYEASEGAASADSPSLKDVEERRPHKRSPGREMTPATKLVVDAAREYLAGRTQPVPLRELYREIAERQSIPIGGNDPVNNLSAMLYRYGFEAVGKAGWRLRQRTTETEDAVSESDDGERHKASLSCVVKPNGEALEIHGAATL
jgi:hypothetical protein